MIIGMDLSDFKPKVDHFEQIHALGEEGSIPGAPNFRQVTISTAAVFHLNFNIPG